RVQCRELQIESVVIRHKAQVDEPALRAHFSPFVRRCSACKVSCSRFSCAPYSAQSPRCWALVAASKAWLAWLMSPVTVPEGGGPGAARVAAVATEAPAEGVWLAGAVAVTAPPAPVLCPRMRPSRASPSVARI